MPRCPLCESDVPDGRASCDRCGQPFDRPLAPRATPDQVRKAVSAARRELVRDANSRIDVTFARGLLERAEQTEASGELGRALELARAARRAADLSIRRTRVDGALAKAEGVLQDAKKAGIETVAFERTIAQAKALAAQGDPGTADRLLRKVSVRTLDQRRERHLQGLLDKAAARVAYARERGGATADAEAVLADAREALALREYHKIRGLAAKAIEKAEAARKYARAEAMLNRAATEVDSARKAGVNVNDSRKLLTQARDALRRGVYADIPVHAAKARHGLTEARRRSAVEIILREAEREVQREERKGADVSSAESILAEAETSLGVRDYAKARSLAQDAHDAAREASLLKHVQEAHAGLRLDLQDLRAFGADADEFESILNDLEAAIGARDLPKARRLVGHARHVHESARDARHRALLEASLKVILMNAARGLDPEVGRDFLRQADDAISLGKSVDVQGLIDRHLTAADEETSRRLNERVLAARDEIVRLRQAGLDTVAMEGKLADAAIAIQEKRFTNADGLLDAVEHDIHSMRENLRGGAAEVLGKARGAVEHAKTAGIPMDESVERMLREAEAAYSESRYGDTVYVGKACLDEIQRLTLEAVRTAEASKEEDRRVHTERAGQIQRRLEIVAREVEKLVAEQVDLAMVVEALVEAGRHLKDGDLDAAERAVSAAEGMLQGTREALRKQGEQAALRVRQEIEAARAEGFLTPAMEASLAEVDAALKSDSLVKPIRLAAALEQEIAARRRDRYQEQQKAALDKARSAASKFIVVKRILEDLRKADIDIAGAEDRLHAAEKALEERAFDDVDTILAGLDETAQELMDELIAAARNLIGRAGRRVQEGRDTGLAVDSAVELLARAEEHFDRREYAEAIEAARAAEKSVQDAMQILESAKAEETRKAQDAARAELASIRKTIADLSRADIAMVGADGALAKAEQAFAEGRYADVPRELAEVEEMSRGLTMGLEAAARDLVQTAEQRVTEVRTAGIDPGRADMVLLNAREAIEDGRYVEAIEYKKVIEDILSNLRKHRMIQSMREQLATIAASIETHSKLGADMRIPTEMLAKAHEQLDAGDVGSLDPDFVQLQRAIDISSKAHLDDVVSSLDGLVDEGVALGLERQALDEFRAQAADAAKAGDLDVVYRLKGDLQEQVLEAKQNSLLRKSREEVDALGDQITQSERLGIPVEQARDHLDQARKAIQAGDVDGFQNSLAEARTALEEGRSSHFTKRYEGRVHAVSTMIANAKRLGAEIGEAESTLDQAEEALRKNDLALADILVKQAEVSVGIQISNFIKNRYPNLVVHLPVAGLQERNWNRYVFEVENRGKLPARNVEFGFEGPLEVKGSVPIPELGVDEKKLVEVGLRPTASGPVPLTVDVTYQRMFDENRYELKDKQTVDIEPAGTYLVEDVFLIHSDGRLISHHSRKFREEIDEDIFSGMLTVVQDFIKDSFRSRASLGIKRLDFGDSKILIERSPHTFLATVVLGHEPQLLPLYVLQVLKEVEDRYGAVLERWTGLLTQLEGVDDLIKRLLLVPAAPGADLGEFADSPITLTARVIDALGTQQTMEANQLLAQAQSALETDIQLAWQFIEQARVQAESAQSQLSGRMEELLAAARDTVQEMKGLGIDTTSAELLLREAEEAYQEHKYDRIREIQQSLHESLERARGEQAAKRMEIELAALINDIQIAKSQTLDVREAESFLTKIEAAIQRRNYRQMEEYLRRAKDSLARQRRHTVLARAQKELAELEASLEEAKEVGADLGDVGVMVEKAREFLKAEDLKDLEPLIDRAGTTLKQRVEQILRDRYPRLFLEETNVGLQANRWNRFELSITNKGDWPAKNVIPVVNGPADVEGLSSIDKIEPNQKVDLEFGIKPREAGTMDLDFEIHYTRPLDDAKHQVTESSVVRVEAEGGYSVDDAILVHSDGRIVAHESRVYVLPGETDKVAALEAEAKALVASAFADPRAKGVQRAAMGEKGVVALKGTIAHLVVTMAGKEPAVLPLYGIQVLQEIHEVFGTRLESWSGDAKELPGISAVVRKMLFATDVPGVSLGPLEDTPVSKIPMLIERGLLRGEGERDFLSLARSAIESGGLASGEEYLRQVQDAAKGPTEEIQTQIQREILAVKESGTLQLSDEQVSVYVEVLRKALEAAFQAKARAGIERYWPVSRLAIKLNDSAGHDAITAFRKIIVGQSLAKELDIIAPNETWRGMKIEVDVHMDSVSAAYKLWSKKIEILLRSQDAWKIKAGLEKGEYSVGIEGQKVRIDPSMLSFVESVPEYVIEEPFDGGIVYLDTRMGKDLLAEGYAREVANIVKETRKEMKVSDETLVDLDIVASSSMRAMLKGWTDMIQREVNALEVRFSPDTDPEAYVVEATLGKETLYLGVKAAEM